MSDTSSSRKCTGGGYIVGANLSVLENKSYFQTSGSKFPVGCNCLRCTLCGGTVRNQVGIRDGEGAHEKSRAIFDEPDMSKSPYITPEASSRLYACGCTIVVVTGGRTFHMPNGVWLCAGHPPLLSGETVLPPMTLSAAESFNLKIANGHIQGAIKLLGITFTDGNGILALPAHVSLGEGWPTLKIWTDEDNQTPMTLDFQKVAGGCVQLNDESLWTY